MLSVCSVWTAVNAAVELLAYRVSLDEDSTAALLPACATSSPRLRGCCAAASCCSAFLCFFAMALPLLGA